MYWVPIVEDDKYICKFQIHQCDIDEPWMGKSFDYAKRHGFNPSAYKYLVINQIVDFEPYWYNLTESVVVKVLDYVEEHPEIISTLPHPVQAGDIIQIEDIYFFYGADSLNRFDLQDFV